MAMTGLQLLPSSQAVLRPPGPLRTGRESFPSPSSSPSNASVEETRLRNGKTQTGFRDSVPVEMACFELAGASGTRTRGLPKLTKNDFPLPPQAFSLLHRP